MKIAIVVLHGNCPNPNDNTLTHYLIFMYVIIYAVLLFLLID